MLTFKAQGLYAENFEDIMFSSYQTKVDTIAGNKDEIMKQLKTLSIQMKRSIRVTTKFQSIDKKAPTVKTLNNFKVKNQKEYLLVHIDNITNKLSLVKDKKLYGVDLDCKCGYKTDDKANMKRHKIRGCFETKIEAVQKEYGNVSSYIENLIAGKRMGPLFLLILAKTIILINA